MVYSAEVSTSIMFHSPRLGALHARTRGKTPMASADGQITRTKPPRPM
ncbi:hypothetical protein HaLaN_07254, partial [Haematococcus lacustris]